MKWSSAKSRVILGSGVGLVGMLVLVTQVGWQRAGVALKLPVGEWVGDGQYAYETWPKQAGPEAPTPISAYNRYPARVTIRSETLEGRPVYLVDIVSQHKDDVGVLKDDVRIRLAVEEAKKLSESAILYRTVGWTMNAAPEEKITYDAGAPRATGSLFREGEDLVFQIHYRPGYTDLFRFRGSALEKCGTTIAPAEDENEQGFIHWVETLKKR